jgi:H+-translocating NAD(P) transhydrogenase subunit alpha
MIIGILREISPETRVALTPETVAKVSQKGVQVWTEQGAGSQAFFQDQEYIKSGAVITPRDEILQKADCILTVAGIPPSELQKIRGRLLIGMLQPFSGKPWIEALMTAQITSFSLELLPRTTLAQSMDVLSSMGTVSGYRAVLDAANHLPRFFPMFMSAAGTIKPVKMLVLGAGVAGLQAIATGRRMGAVVEVFDVRSAVKEEVQSLGGKFIEVEGAVEDKASGGYAIAQTDDFLARQRELIHQHAIKSDVVICTAMIPGKRAPQLLFRRTVEAMRDGSVIVDLAASTGGNCELTENNKTVIVHHVTIIGKSDYPASMPMDASQMMSHNFLSFIQPMLDENGKLKINWEDEIISGAGLTHEGKVVNTRIKQFYNL